MRRHDRNATPRVVMALIALLATAVVLGAASSDDGDIGVGAEGESYTDESASALLVWEYDRSGINALSNAAEAVVEATVMRVSAPRWNSADGESWERDVRDASEYAYPMQYRDATLEVVRNVVPGSRRLPLAEGDHVSVRLWGSGVSGGGQYEELPFSFDEVSGPFDEGSSVLVLLRNSTYPMRTGPVDIVRVVGHFEGMWTLRSDGRADSVLDERDVPRKDDLLARIQQERAAGPGNVDPKREERSERNPVAP